MTARCERPGSARSAATVPAVGCRRRIGCAFHVILCRRAGFRSLIRSGDTLSIELIEPDTNATVVRIVWPSAPTITTPARYNEVASTAMLFSLKRPRDSPGSKRASDGLAWAGRPQVLQDFAPPPPGRPAFPTLWSSGQGVHVHRTNIAPVALAGGSRWRCIEAPFSWCGRSKRR